MQLFTFFLNRMFCKTWSQRGPSWNKFWTQPEICRSRGWVKRTKRSSRTEVRGQVQRSNQGHGTIFLKQWTLVAQFMFDVKPILFNHGIKELYICPTLRVYIFTLDQVNFNLIWCVNQIITPLPHKSKWCHRFERTKKAFWCKYNKGQWSLINFSGEITRALGRGLVTCQSEEDPAGRHAARVPAVWRDARRVWALARTDRGGSPCQPSQGLRDQHRPADS